MQWQFFRRKGQNKSEDLPNVDESWTEIRCPLCGKTFRAGEAQPCTTCAIAVHCGLVMCPNCSYEFAA
jgi:hypothetical protein